MTIFTTSQESAIASVRRWHQDKNGPQVFRLFGFAGTGKTSMAISLAEGMDGAVAFAAFTGKAASVMRKKGCAGASTVHSLIYKPKKIDKTKLLELNASLEILNKKTPSQGSEKEARRIRGEIAAIQDVGISDAFVLKDKYSLDAKLIVLDECSMIDERLGEDLLSFGKKVLVLGDPGQLPPIKGCGYFVGADAPDVMLTEIHRQALDNPVLALATDVREGRPLREGAYGESRVVARKALSPEEIDGADQILAGKNATRTKMNAYVRRRRGRIGEFPGDGEKLVCLKNDRETGLLNGSMWRVLGSSLFDDKRKLRFDVFPEDGDDGSDPLGAVVMPECFRGGVGHLSYAQRKGFDEFDYGYCMTVHKSQGSEWENVLLLDESSAFREDKAKWLYTAITRASERITIATDGVHAS